MAAETLSMTLLAVCVFVLLPHAASSHGTIPQPVEPAHYIGCMIPDHLVSVSFTADNIATELTQRLASFQNNFKGPSVMSARGCVLICWLVKKTYAGIQNGSSCFCSDTLNGMTGVRDKDCKILCSSACNDQCGGFVALSVFKTSYRDLSATFIDASQFRSVRGIGRRRSSDEEDTEVKRYMFDPNLSSLPYLPVVLSNRLSAQACAVYCLTSKMKYTIILSPIYCCCGWLEQSLGQREKDPDPCTKSCSGDETTPCYGSTTDVVYSAVFNNIALMEKTDIPVMTLKQFNASGILYPYIAGIYGFPSKRRSADVIEYLKGLAESPVQTQAGSPPKKTTHQIVDPTNTGVGVVDVPEKTSDSNVKVVLGIALVLLLGAFVVVFCVKRAKKASPTTE